MLTNKINTNDGLVNGAVIHFLIFNLKDVSIYLEFIIHIINEQKSSENVDKK